MNSATLLQNLTNAEDALVQARAAIINEIIARLGDASASQFAIASGINRGNFYSLLNGKWNAIIAVQSLLALDGMAVELIPHPKKVKKVHQRPTRERKQPMQPVEQPVEVAP